MTEAGAKHVWHFRYGEAHDDLRTAFYIDERSYPDSATAQHALQSARSALRRLGVIFDTELLYADDCPSSPAVPSWEQFRQLHLVEGQPIPVRPRPASVEVPPTWQAMHEEMRQADGRFRDEIVRLLESAFPEFRVVVDRDRGPVRRSAGSVDWSAEKYGFEIDASCDIGDLAVDKAMDRMTRVLRDAGWEPKDPGDSALRSVRDQYEIFVDADPGLVFVLGRSPLFSAPAAPATTWITEPRR